MYLHSYLITYTSKALSAPLGIGAYHVDVAVFGVVRLVSVVVVLGKINTIFIDDAGLECL